MSPIGTSRRFAAVRQYGRSRGSSRDIADPISVNGSSKCLLGNLVIPNDSAENEWASRRSPVARLLDAWHSSMNSMPGCRCRKVSNTDHLTQTFVSNDGRHLIVAVPRFGNAL